MASITPCQRVISDRFPVASFVVQVPPDRLFEIACATDPRLLRGDHRERRTHENFFTSRGAGLLRAPAGHATYLLPLEQLRRFAGQQRLYYALGTYGDARGRDAQFSVDHNAAEAAPCIRISPDFSGRTLDRTRLRRPTVDARYGSATGAPLTWGGDEEAPAPPAVAQAAAYDDGYPADLWKTEARAQELGDPPDPPDANAQAFDEPLAYEGSPDSDANRRATAAYGGVTQPPPRRAAHGAPAAMPPAPAYAAPPSYPSPPAYAAPPPVFAGDPATATPLERPAPRPSAFTPPAGDPIGFEDGPAVRAGRRVNAPALGSAAALGGSSLDEPPGFEHAPALAAPAYGGAHDEPPGFEDGPALHARARYGAAAAPAPVTPAAASPTAAPAPAAAAEDPYDDDSGNEPLHLPGLPVNGALPLTIESKLRVILPSARLDSGDAGNAYVEADEHHGLRWGFIKFSQRHGSLGRVLSVCMRRDPTRFRHIFGRHADELLRVTNAPTPEGRLAPVENVVLWQEPWLSRFRAAGAEHPFQVAEVEAAIEHRFDPLLGFAASLGLNTDRALGMLFDRCNHMGIAAGKRFISAAVAAVKPGDVPAMLDAIVAAARGRRFQARVEALRSSADFSDAVYQVA